MEEQVLGGSFGVVHLDWGISMQWGWALHGFLVGQDSLEDISSLEVDEVVLVMHRMERKSERRGEPKRSCKRHLWYNSV